MNGTVEPRQLEAGWLGRTQSAAWLEVRAKPSRSALLAIAPLALCYVLPARWGALLVAPVSLYALYLAFVPRKSRSRADAVILFTLLLFSSPLVIRDWIRIDPTQEFIWQVYEIHLFTYYCFYFGYSMIPSIFWYSSEPPPGGIKFIFLNPFGLLLYADSDLEWWTCYVLGKKGEGINLKPLGWLLVPGIVLVMFPPILPFVAAWYVAIYREIFYGPKQVPAKVHLARAVAVPSIGRA
jgi:hypothetical protein